MSRSARQWNDHRAHIKLLEGDLNECHKWYGLALIRLKFLLEHQPGSVTDAMSPVEGVYIRVDTRPNRVHIKVEEGGIYLESGFLDLLSAARCAENTYKPAVLHFNSGILAYRGLHPEFDWWQGKVIATDLLTVKGEDISDGYESLAVGCTGKQDSVVALPPCTQVYSNGGYCDPKKIYQKKEAQANTPASMFSGKLRLWIQALYGQKQCRYSAAKGIDGRVLPGRIYIGDKEYTEDSETFVTRKLISALYAPSYGLFTTEDYQYFLVEVSSVVKYYPLKITSAAEKIRAMLNAPPPEATSEDIKRAEAYVLSTAHVDDAGMKTSGAVTPLGLPIYYGWHFTWNGQRADIVTHQQNYSNQTYTTRHYKLEFTFDGTNFSHTLTLIDSGSWWPTPLGLNIFKPYPDDGNMAVVMPITENELGAPVSAPGFDGTSAGPVHCYRSLNDELVMCEWEMDVSIRSDSVITNDGEVCWSMDFVVNDSKTYNGAVGDVMLTVGAETSAGSHKSIGSYNNTKTFIDGPPVFRVSAGPGTSQLNGIASSTLCSGTNGQAYLLANGTHSLVGSTLVENTTGETVGSFPVRWRAALYGVPHHSEQHFGSIESSGNSAHFLMLPFSSCSNVIFGRREIDYRPNDNARTSPTVTTRNTHVGAYKHYFNGVTTVTYDGGPFYLAPYPSSGISEASGSVVSTSFDTKSTESYLVTAGISAENKISTGYVGDLSGIFDINYGSFPFFNSYVVSKQSIEKYYNCIFVGTVLDGDYEKDSAVGWA